MQPLRIDDLPATETVNDDELDSIMGGMPNPNPDTGCILPDHIRS